MVVSRARFWLLATLGAIASLWAIVAIGYYLQQVAPRLLEDEFLGSNLGFFLLINVNVILALVLGFLTVKNVVKLVFDRRRNILGSRLRGRLVAAFVGLALIPTVLLFLVAKGMLSSLLQGWFEPQVAASVDGALTVAKSYYEDSEAQIRRDLIAFSRDLERFAPVFPRPGERQMNPLARLFQERLEDSGLTELTLVDEQGQVVVSAHAAPVAGVEWELPAFNSVAEQSARDGEVLVRPEQTVNGEFLRGYAPLAVTAVGGSIESLRGSMASPASIEGPNRLRYVLAATRWIPSELQSALTSVVDAHDDYKELRIYRRPLASSYVLALVVVTVMIFFAAVWVGFYLARSLTVPIQLLAAGTEHVAHGNLDHRIPEVGDDELSVLVRSFNKMTEDLKRTTGELEQRRRYMEAILADIDVGVISVDIESKVTTFNNAAAEMLGVERIDQTRSYKELVRLLPPELGKRALELMNELYSTTEKMVTAELSLYVHGNTRHLQATATKLLDEGGKFLGAVILLNDLTELISAQRMSAWREVARRIAHEIKNPLTPIQLSAQRMQRRLGAESGKSELAEGDRAVVTECTDTIVNQVEALRALVNEFSRFARMPKSDPRPMDLNALIRETGGIYREAHPEIEFSLQLRGDIPEVDLDRDQITRVLVNLLDNAVASIHESSREMDDSTVRGRISIASEIDMDLGMVSIIVADDGAGISDTDKPKLFEPYFSKKKGGTGLGLAIVSSIVSDHSGYIRVRDNEPRGAVFVVELPLRQAVLQKRAVG